MLNGVVLRLAEDQEKMFQKQKQCEEHKREMKKGGNFDYFHRKVILRVTSFALL